MARLDADLFVLARLDAGVPRLEQAAFDLTALVSASCREMARVAAGRDVRVVYDEEVLLSLVMQGDAGCPWQTLLILQDNVATYNHEDGLVAVAVAAPYAARAYAPLMVP